MQLRVATLLAERDDAAASQPGSAGASLSGRYSRRAAFGGDYGQRLLALLQDWRSSLFERMARTYTILETTQSYPSFPTTSHPEPVSQSRFDLFQPPLGATCPPGSPFERLGGDGDGGKWLCAGSFLNATGCVIYSVGSNDQWEFEDAMLAETACEVHTFDCTSPARTRGPRHHFHPICVGVPREGVQCSYGDNCRIFERVRYRSWEQITAALGHERIDLLKVDIEGFEYDFFASLRESTGCALPSQIAVEIHYRRLYNDESVPSPGVGSTNLFRGGHVLSLGELAAFAAHLSNLGYLPVGREPNPEGMDCCSEFTLLRAEEPFACRAVAHPAGGIADLLDDAHTNLTRSWDVNVTGAIKSSFWIDTNTTKASTNDAWYDVNGTNPFARDIWNDINGTNPFARDVRNDINGTHFSANDIWPDVNGSALGTRESDGFAGGPGRGSRKDLPALESGRQGGVAAGTMLLGSTNRQSASKTTAQQVAAALGNVAVEDVQRVMMLGSAARSAEEENPQARPSANVAQPAGTRTGESRAASANAAATTGKRTLMASPDAEVATRPAKRYGVYRDPPS